MKILLIEFIQTIEDIYETNALDAVRSYNTLSYTVRISYDIVLFICIAPCSFKSHDSIA